MDKEQKWLEARLGKITASELNEIVSAKGGIIETNLSYIRKKRWERLRGFSHNVFSKIMDKGNEVEPEVYEWSKANLDIPGGIIYSKDEKEIPFWIAPDCPLGASPDAFNPQQDIVLEFKTLVGNTSIEFFGDIYTSYEEKRSAVLKDHKEQILGLFISNPKVQEVILVKYIYSDDDIVKDSDSPLAPWRGIPFSFKRREMEEEIAAMKDRIRLIDAMIDSHINPSEFKKGEWYVTDGEIHRK